MKAGARMAILACSLAIVLHGATAEPAGSAKSKPKGKQAAPNHPDSCWKIPTPPNPLPPHFDWAPLAADWCRQLAACGGFDTTGCAAAYLDAIEHPITEPVLPPPGGTISSEWDADTLTCRDTEEYYAGTDPCPVSADDPEGLPAPATAAVHAEDGGARIRITLRANSHVVLSVYSAAGRLIRRIVTSKVEAGTYDCFWNGRNDKRVKVARGIYQLRMVTATDSTASIVALP